ncbi:UDP-glycosyltransferase 73C11-like [Arachis duranensis]|uniref:Glycosyltransferase n=1 Tax=Arachis duranensis TaxID=130453 RepID=A0A6P4D8T0_ARADU|nr:UDP-glycosyltransferase 73C11-like [Arachis duranensis]
MTKEIWVLPFFGQGHLFPCMELCKHLASRNFQVTLVITSNVASSVPSSLRQHPLIRVAEISPEPASHPEPRIHPPHHAHGHLSSGLEKLLLSPSNPTRPACAVVDVMMTRWFADLLAKHGIPTVAFFTSGAIASAMEHAKWKAYPIELKPGETRILPGMPDSVALTDTDLKRRPREERRPPRPPPGLGDNFPPPPGGRGFRRMGPPEPGEEPMWMEETREATALMFNTCQEMERPFMDYMANQTGKPVWGVGPLLPEQYWNSAGLVLRDREFRSDRKSSVTEDGVLQWLDSKPRGSVLYVSFGTEVGPTVEEYVQLSEALESSGQPFILVLRPGSGKSVPPRAMLGLRPGLSSPEEDDEGYSAEGLDERVGDRGLIIRGWAPQLLILSHPSTGGFLSHCGWNSTVEALGLGVPILAWPFRGDQYHNAKLVVAHLKVGYMVSDDLGRTLKKDDVIKGIEKLTGDKEMKKRAENLGAQFQQGFPRSSVTALDAFKDYANKTWV